MKGISANKWMQSYITENEKKKTSYVTSYTVSAAMLLRQFVLSLSFFP